MIKNWKKMKCVIDFVAFLRTCGQGAAEIRGDTLFPYIL